jgi:hypothetical protein
MRRTSDAIALLSRASSASSSRCSRITGCHPDHHRVAAQHSRTLLPALVAAPEPGQASETHAAHPACPGGSGPRYPSRSRARWVARPYRTQSYLLHRVGHGDGHGRQRDACSRCPGLHGCPWGARSRSPIWESFHWRAPRTGETSDPGGSGGGLRRRDAPAQCSVRPWGLVKANRRTIAGNSAGRGQ